MTNDSILLRVKQSEFFDRIVTPQTICVLVGGSRINGLVDERSDYDLTVISTETSDDGVIKEYLMCEGKKIHWYNWRIYDLLNLENIKFPLFWVGLSKLYWLSEKDLVYVNPTYKEQFDSIFAEKEVIAKKAANLLCNHYQSLVCTIANDVTVQEDNYTKFLYQLCIASYVICEQTLITDEEKELLKQLKRIRWKPVSYKVKEYCVDRFKIIKEKMSW